ncbi:uncharacterized protein LOC125235004 [Leguminivora glycinivorella]|uniref:uncharacterized protein LOC125235004 n=1 Tax=Leguminivora glycinivorella TaxID=1035111 RepID=UPI00200E1572|nr:uncharacterized protein LOC125235004 [Leguminivora glycinivorella]
MPIKINVHEQHVGAFSKLRCLISIFGVQCQEQTQDFVVNNLAKVRLHFRVQSQTLPLSCNILALPLENNNKIRVIVSCQDTDVPFVSRVLLDRWTQVGSKQNCDIAVDKFRTCLISFIIFASKFDDFCPAKIYNDADFTDFNLTAPEGSIAVHRVILAAYSDVFRAMLSHEWKETMEGRIEIEGVTLQTLQYLKQYMYLRKLPNDGLKPLLLLASYYLIDDLKADCLSKLVLNYKSGEWSSLLEFAVENKLSELTSAIMLVNSAVDFDHQQAPVKKQKIEQ